MGSAIRRCLQYPWSLGGLCGGGAEPSNGGKDVDSPPSGDGERCHLAKPSGGVYGLTLACLHAVNAARRCLTSAAWRGGNWQTNTLVTQRGSTHTHPASQNSLFCLDQSAWLPSGGRLWYNSINVCVCFNLKPEYLASSARW